MYVNDKSKQKKTITSVQEIRHFVRNIQRKVGKQKLRDVKNLEPKPEEI